MIDLRPATLADIPLLREFEQGVVEAERPFSPNLVDGPAEYYDLEQLIASDQSLLLLAEHDSEVVGCGYASIRDDKPYFVPARFSYLGFMYVRPESRGKGVITRVIEGLQEWSRENGVNTFKLDVYHDNVPAMRAYKKLGFQANLLEMWASD